MDRRAFMNFITKRSTIWTLSLCMTGALALGGIALVDNAFHGEEQQQESELEESAFLEEQIAQQPEAVNDTLEHSLNEAEVGSVEEVSGGVGTGDGLEGTGAENAAVGLEDTPIQSAVNTDGENVDNSTDYSEASGNLTSEAIVSDAAAEEAAALGGVVITEQTLIDAGVQFTEENSLMWPSAGTILIDYSMDGSVYFPTLNQYKYNPALIIGSETGNQVLASAKGIVESVGVDEETGTTLVLNIGNGYKLTYGQLKELAVSEGDVVKAGALIGYISEPTKYYSEEGSNLYFAMTQNEETVDPVLYLEG